MKTAMKIIRTDSELLDKISTGYHDCKAAVEEAIVSLNAAKEKVVDGYNGQANEIVNETFQKLEEHLRFFEECLSQCSKYTAYTKEVLEEADKDLMVSR